MSKDLKMSIRQNQGDGIISAVLDEVIELKGWGPEAIFPDHVLSSDLEMNDLEIAEFAKRLSTKLNFTFDFSNWASFSLKQIVDHIRSIRQAKAA